MDSRTKIMEIVSRMLDNPDEHDIYPTTKCYDELEALLQTQVERAEKQMQVNDRLVMLGWMEANQDNLTVEEIIATIRGQMMSIGNELAALTTNPNGDEHEQD